MGAQEALRWGAAWPGCGSDGRCCLLRGQKAQGWDTGAVRPRWRVGGRWGGAGVERGVPGKAQGQEELRGGAHSLAGGCLSSGCRKGIPNGGLGFWSGIFWTAGVEAASVLRWGSRMRMGQGCRAGRPLRRPLRVTRLALSPRGRAHVPAQLGPAPRQPCPANSVISTADAATRILRCPQTREGVGDSAVLSRGLGLGFGSERTMRMESGDMALICSCHHSHQPCGSRGTLLSYDC